MPNRPTFENAPAHGAGFFVWSAPGAACTVHLHLAVVDRLAREIREAAAGARGGRAVCGLLLGRTVGEGGSIVIEDSLPLSCGDEGSPASHFREAGKAVLSKALSQWTPGEDKRLWAVGYYQHQKAGELVAGDDEAAVVENDLKGAGKVLLLTGLSGAGQPVGVFFPKAAATIERQPAVTFPLSRMELRRPPEPRPTAAPFLPEEVERPRRPRRFTQYDAIRWTSVSIVVLTVAAIAISQLPRWRTQSGGGPAKVEYTGAELRLAIEGAPDRVTVTWNGSARAIADAVEGTLSVTDQGSTQILMLKRTDLTMGSLVYFPSGNDVQFRLDVTTRDGRLVSARTRFLAGRRPDARR